MGGGTEVAAATSGEGATIAVATIAISTCNCSGASPRRKPTGEDDRDEPGGEGGGEGGARPDGADRMNVEDGEGGSEGNR